MKYERTKSARERKQILTRFYTSLSCNSSHFNNNVNTMEKEQAIEILKQIQKLIVKLYNLIDASKAPEEV
jgi:hypothetical protein